MNRTPELTFIKKLEVYLDEKFNEYTVNRILSYLKEYKIETTPIVVKKQEEESAELEKEYRNSISEMKSQYEILRKKEFATQEILMAKAADISELYKVSLDEFMNGKTNKAKHEIVNARKIFCEYIHCNYLIKNNDLAAFFGVHHSTISFYLYGKNYPAKRRKIAKFI